MTYSHRLPGPFRLVEPTTLKTYVCTYPLAGRPALAALVCPGARLLFVHCTLALAMLARI